MSLHTSDPAYAFRRHFDDDERRIDLLAEKFALLQARGVTTRKLEKWASVVHLRMTQLATTDGFGLAEREITKIKGAYFHALGKAEQELDKIRARDGMVLAAEATSPEPKTLDERKLAAEIHSTFLEIASGAPPDQVVVFERQATWRYIATHVVLSAQIDDRTLRDATGSLQSLEQELERTADAKKRELLLDRADQAERHLDRELERLLRRYGLGGMVERLRAQATTNDPSRAPRPTQG